MLVSLSVDISSSNIFVARHRSVKGVDALQTFAEQAGIPSLTLAEQLSSRCETHAASREGQSLSRPVRSLASRQVERVGSLLPTASTCQRSSAGFPIQLPSA